MKKLLFIALLFCFNFLHLNAQDTINKTDRHWRVSIISVYGNTFAVSQYNGVPLGGGNAKGCDFGLEYAIARKISTELKVSYHYAGLRYDNLFDYPVLLVFNRKAVEINCKWNFISLKRSKNINNYFHIGGGAGFFIPGELHWEYAQESVTANYYPSVGMQLFAGYNYSLNNKISLSIAGRIRIVEFTPTRKIYSYETIRPEDFDPLNGWGSDICLGLIYYFGKSIKQ